MQTPICEVCLKSNILCSSCKQKLDKGEIEKNDIEISRFIFNLSGEVKSIRDVKIVKIIDCGVLLIITGRGDAAKLVGRKGSVVKLIAKEFKKSIRILEEASNFKEFVHGLISPVSINGINTLYKENEEVYKIRIPAIEKHQMMFPPETFSEIIFNFYNRKAEIVFEN